MEAYFSPLMFYTVLAAASQAVGHGLHRNLLELHNQNEGSSQLQIDFKKSPQLNIVAKPLLFFALLAATLGLVFAVLNCFEALTSGSEESTTGMNARRLAVGYEDPCGVSLLSVFLVLSSV